MKLVRAGVVAGLTVAQGLVFAGAAHAAATSVHVSQGQLLIRSSDQTANRLDVLPRDGKVYVFDMATLTAGRGCEQVNPTLVACRAEAVSSVSAWLGDGDDHATFKVLLPVKADGGNGDDTLTGSQSGDTLSGNDGNDTIHGGPGNDLIHGGDGYDDLFGDDGNDILDDYRSGTKIEATKFDGGPGNDKIIGTGQEMRDMVIYPRSTAVYVNLSPVAYQGIPAGTGGEVTLNEQDTITDVRNIQTGSGDDILIGGDFGALLFSGTGNDTCGYYDNGVVIKVCP